MRKAIHKWAMAQTAAAAAAAMIVCVLTNEAWADPQVYCEPYAHEAASRKTGQVDLPTGTIGEAPGDPTDSNEGAATTGDEVTDGKWQEAYDKAYASCMSNYEPRQAASGDAGGSQEEAEKPERQAKASKQRRASKSVKRTRRASASSATKQRRVERPSKKAQAARPRRVKAAQQRRVRGPSISGTAAAKAKAAVESRDRQAAPKVAVSQRPSELSPKCRVTFCKVQNARPKP